MTRQAWLVLVTAIAGLALAVALAVLTSHLTAQHVGLAGEPSRPASGLVAPMVRRARPAPQPASKRPKPKTAPPAVVTAPPVTVTVPPVIVTPTAPRPSTTATSPQKTERENGDD
jgi:hypothetical protein